VHVTKGGSVQVAHGSEQDALHLAPTLLKALSGVLSNSPCKHLSMSKSVQLKPTRILPHPTTCDTTARESLIVNQPEANMSGLQHVTHMVLLGKSFLHHISFASHQKSYSRYHD
jgi:hypothetical protein